MSVSPPTCLLFFWIVLMGRRGLFFASLAWGSRHGKRYFLQHLENFDATAEVKTTF